MSTLESHALKALTKDTHEDAHLSYCINTRKFKIGLGRERGAYNNSINILVYYRC